MRKAVHAEKPAEVLEKQRHAAPESFLTSGESRPVEHRSQQIDREVSDAPQPDDAGEGEQHAHDRVAPPPRIGKQFRHRSKPNAGGRRSLPFFRFLFEFV